MKYDRIIIGAGLYGLYAALKSAENGMRVLVIESDPRPFMRATYINQARLHQGYHYPRSLYTAIKSANNYRRFCEDYGFCINDSFDQIYATSDTYSWSNAAQFIEFCTAANIPCSTINPDKYFNKNMCDGAFLTQECTYDASILCDYFMNKLNSTDSSTELKYLPTFKFGTQITSITRDSSTYYLELNNKEICESDFVINATYASVNQILSLVGLEGFKIKYEMCEIILCEPSEELKHIGITVMDGPFFSIMPFGKTGLHSLTSVTFTPHMTSYDPTPSFPCQDLVSEDYCSPHHLGNCNECKARPASAFSYMSNLANKYLLEKYSYSFKESLISMKPILVSSEVDDSRPTVIRMHSKNPTFISVLSGKINTVYDLDEILVP